MLAEWARATLNSVGDGFSAGRFSFARSLLVRSSTAFSSTVISNFDSAGCCASRLTAGVNTHRTRARCLPYLMLVSQDGMRWRVTLSPMSFYPGGPSLGSKTLIDPALGCTPNANCVQGGGGAVAM